jgi:hypothetical protein
LLFHESGKLPVLAVRPLCLWGAPPRPRPLSLRPPLSPRPKDLPRPRPSLRPLIDPDLPPLPSPRALPDLPLLSLTGPSLVSGLGFTSSTNKLKPPS